MQDWTVEAAKRVVLITDAPPHGKQYHNYQRYGDDYPNGSPDGLILEDLIKEFAEKEIDFQVIKLNGEFDKTIDVIKTIIPNLEVTDMSGVRAEVRARGGRGGYAEEEAYAAKKFVGATVSGLKGSLQKMMDKRALFNEEKQKKLLEEIKDFTSKLDFEMLAEREKNVVDDVGDCINTFMNPVEALKANDCFGIGLSIQRPEAAIADPSRLQVVDIFPVYMTSDSFIDAAKFKLEGKEGVAGDSITGGFKTKENADLAKTAKIVEGLNKENITGILPLALFNEHWSVARRKMAPVLGFMCTLNIQGFVEE